MAGNSSTAVAQDRYDVLVIGSGHAGVQMVTSLRQGGFEGSIALVSGDTHQPYDRPSLSKDYLMGKKSIDQILLAPKTFWSTKQVDLLLNKQVAAVDPDRQSVKIADGGTIGYGKLVWATGGDARRLTIPGADLDGIFYLRSLADSEYLKSRSEQAQTICIIGAGYIGLEAAAVLSAAGKQVIVIEAADRVLARVAGPDLSAFYYDAHTSHGVDIRLNTPVEQIEGHDGRVTGVCAGGDLIACDMVIAGIGIIPATAPITDAGAEGENGVTVDSECRTSLDHIFAIGDCAAQVSAFAGNTPIRIESVGNAADQAKSAAKSILGKAEANSAAPWFWSNQYDLRLQTVGLSIGYDETVLRGDIAAKSFSVIYLKQGRIIALDCVNATKDYVQGRKLVEAAAQLSAQQLADVSVPLKALLLPA